MPRRWTVWHAWCWVGIAAASLWLRAGFPTVALGGAGADDALFIRLAQALRSGQWLGPYDNLTLAKGMFYPLFIAANSWAGIPLNLAEHGVYLLVCGGTAAYAARQTGRAWLGTLLFALLAFNPVFWDRQLARVIREGLYDSLSPAAVVLCVAACCSTAGLSRRIAAGCALGAMLAAFWLTREEGVWLLPALGSIPLVAAALIFREPRPWSRLSALAVTLACAALVFAGAVGGVATLNGRYYGAAVTTEFKSASFLRAYGALAGIQPDQWRRYVVFPADARARAYAVSPAAKALAPFFEGEAGENWRRVACGQTGLDRAACPEILAGWFMWALRDAVSDAGQAQSGRQARQFYNRLANEIDSACADGRLACVSAGRATLAPPFRWRYVRDAWRRAALVARLVFTLGGGNTQAPASEGLQTELAGFADLAGPIAPVTGPVMQHLRGWAAASGGMPSLAVMAEPGTTDTALTVLNGGDVERSFPGQAALRFDLVTSCRPAVCSLVMSAPGMPPVTLPWSGLKPGMAVSTAAAGLNIEALSSFVRAPATTARQALARQAAAAIASVLCAAFPVLAGLGVAGTVAAAWRRALPGWLLALLLASALAIAARIALLAYLDVTSIPAANSLYTSPASAFVVLFSVLGLYAGGVALMRAPGSRAAREC